MVYGFDAIDSGLNDPVMVLYVLNELVLGAARTADQDLVGLGKALGYVVKEVCRRLMLRVWRVLVVQVLMAVRRTHVLRWMRFVAAEANDVGIAVIEPGDRVKIRHVHSQ